MDKHIVTSVEQLREVYGRPRETSLAKEVDRIIPHYASYIEASPFVIIGSAGQGGLDCSPRGDRPGFVHIEDDKTLLLPDRAGNNRIDTLENIVNDGRIAMLFLVPGSGMTLRVNGNARISVDPDRCERFAVEGKAPRSVLVVTVSSVYFQCARAILRSGLWDSENHVDPKTLPTPGQILAVTSGERLGGQEYDDDWAKRAPKSLW